MNIKVCPKCGKHNLKSAWSCTDCGETLSIKTLVDANDAQLLSEIQKLNVVTQIKITEKGKKNNQQHIPISEKTTINVAKEGLKFGGKIGFKISTLYGIVGFFAVELFGDGIGIFSVKFESIAQTVWVIFAFTIIILILAITPATIVGSLTGMYMAVLANTKRRHISKYFFVLLCVLFSLVAVILIHLLFQIPITLSFENPPHEFSLGTYETYPFYIGIPSIIYIFSSGWVGLQFYSKGFTQLGKNE